MTTEFNIEIPAMPEAQADMLVHVIRQQIAAGQIRTEKQAQDFIEDFVEIKAAQKVYVLAGSYREYYTFTGLLKIKNKMWVKEPHEVKLVPPGATVWFFKTIKSPHRFYWDTFTAAYEAQLNLRETVTLKWEKI